MHKEKLTYKYIGFCLDRYENDIISWLDIVVKFFEEKGYPLKSVIYDIDYNKIETKTLKTFFKKLDENPSLPVDKFYSFLAYSAEKQSESATAHYGASYDMPSKQFVLFFDSSYGEDKILTFYKEIISLMLKDKSVHSGYLYHNDGDYTYSNGGRSVTLGYYKESGRTWWQLSNINRRDETFSNKNKYRHIYEQNILSEYHLQEKIDGLYMIDWIKKNSYGTVEKIGIANWLWTVPKEKLTEIQIIFYDKGLLMGVD